MENAHARPKLRYDHRTELGTEAMSVILNKFLMCLLCFMASLGSTQWGLDMLNLNVNNFNVLMIPLGITAMLFVMLSFRNRDITNGIVLLFLSMSQMTNTISRLAFDSAGFTWQQVFFVFGFAVAAYIYHTRKQIDAYPCAILCITIVLSTFIHGFGHQIACVGYFACGTLYFISASHRLYYHCVKKVPGEFLAIHLNDPSETYDEMLFNTAGIISFSILAMFLCFYILDGSDAITLHIVKMVISTITLIFGLYSLTHNIIDEGLLMFCTSLNMFIFSLMYLIGYPEPVFMSVITCAINLSLAIKFLRKNKKLIFAIIALALAIIFLLESIFIYVKYMEVALMFLRVLMGTVALLSWIEYETGRTPFKMVSNIRKKFLLTTKHEDNKNDMTPYLTSGILLLWMGSNYILYNFDSMFNMDLYYMVSLILSTLPIMFIRSIFNECRTSNGIMIAIIAISTFVISLTKLTYMESIPNVTYFIFFIGSAVCMMIFMKLRDFPMFFLSLTMVVTYLIKSIIQNPLAISSGLLYILSGTLLMSDVFLTVALGDKWQKKMAHRDRQREWFSNPVLTTTPFVMYLVGLICLMFTFENPTFGFCMLNLALAAVLIVTAFLELMNGDVYSFPLVLMMTVIAVTNSFATLMDAGSSYIIYVPIVIIGLISAPSYIINGRIPLGITCLVCGTLTLLGIVANLDFFLKLGFTILGVVSLIYATNMWFANDLGRCFSRTFLFRDLFDEDDYTYWGDSKVRKPRKALPVATSCGEDTDT